MIAVKSQDAALYYPLALSLLKDGKLDAANRVIEQMVAVGTNIPQLHILFSQAHYERGDVAKALEELRAALSLDDKVRLAHFYIGLIHLESRKTSGRRSASFNRSCVESERLSGQVSSWLSSSWPSRKRNEASR